MSRNIQKHTPEKRNAGAPARKGTGILMPSQTPQQDSRESVRDTPKPAPPVPETSETTTGNPGTKGLEPAPIKIMETERGEQK